MSSAFADVAARLAANGYRPLPIMPGTKRPGFDGWQNFAFVPGCEDRFPEHGAGLLLGDVVALDIDVDDEDASAACQAAVRDALGLGDVAEIPRRIGRHPRALLLFRCETPFGKIKSASFELRATGTKAHVEVLAQGQQCVGYGTHPDTGRSYEWTAANPLLVPRAELIAIDEAKARELVRVCEDVLEEHGDRADEQRAAITPAATDNNDRAGIGEGGRNDYLTREAGRMRRIGMSPAEVEAGLQRMNLDRCKPPLDHAEVKAIAGSVGRYDPATAEATHEWPDPQPLPLGLPPVAAFDVHLLPTSLQAWGADIVDRMRCPPDYVGVSIMASVAAVVGRKVAIRPKQHDDWTVIPNLWGFLVGRPGVLKSPAMEESLKPMKRLIAKAIEAHKGELHEYKAKSIVTKMKNDAINKAAAKTLLKNPAAIVNVAIDDDSDEGPPLHRYMTNDSTMAALGELLRQNPNGLLVHRDELVSLLRSLDQEENADARGFFLTGWNGDSSYTSDRIGRGMNLHVEAVCLSLLGSSQPARITEYVSTAVRGGAGDDGMLQRFGLMVWPDVGGEWVNVDRSPDLDALRTAHQTFDHLDTLDYRALGARRDVDHLGDEHGIPYLRLDASALDVFNEWREPLEHELRAGTLHPAIESHYAKYRKLVPALALLTHLADHGRGKVSADAVNRAIAWSTYLRTHANRVYAAATNADAVAARAIVKRIRKGDLTGSFAGWEVWRKGWALLSHRQTVADALALLVDLGYLRQQTRETNGRSATVYLVNPKIARDGE